MEAVVHVLGKDDRLTAAAQEALHALCGVPRSLLADARARPASMNWLHAPWYPYRRGGALTLGTTIYLTRIFFDPAGYADGRITSTWEWLHLLAHEVGHLPQAARFGLSMTGRMRYVGAFVGQYGARALTFRSRVHDDAPLEIEADRGRWVLQQLVRDDDPTGHPLVKAVHANDVAAVRAWYAEARVRIEALDAQYRAERGLRPTSLAG